MRQDRDRCPRCGGIGAVIDYDPLLGFIYECFGCTETMEILGGLHTRSITWAVVRGEKQEVIG